VSFFHGFGEPESHAQDGEKLPRVHARNNSVWRSCHGISNLALSQERSLSALAKFAGCVHRCRLNERTRDAHPLHESHRARLPCAE
jgi:hypothetical protein